MAQVLAIRPVLNADVRGAAVSWQIFVLCSKSKQDALCRV